MSIPCKLASAYTRPAQIEITKAGLTLLSIVADIGTVFDLKATLDEPAGSVVQVVALYATQVGNGRFEVEVAENEVVAIIRSDPAQTVFATLALCLPEDDVVLC